MYKKIDIYYDGKYICSTNQAKNLKIAKENFVKNPAWQGLKLDEKFNLFPILGTCKIDNVDILKVKTRYSSY